MIYLIYLFNYSKEEFNFKKKYPQILILTIIVVLFFYFKIKYFISIVGFSTINKLNCLFRIFGILKFGILIYGILKNIFSLDVLNFPSDSFLNFDNPNSETPEPTGATEPPNTGPVGPTEFTEPTGATEREIYLANRPNKEIVNWILADIKLYDPDYYNWLNKDPILQSKEVNYSFFKFEGKNAAFKAGHINNSPGFNEYIERYTTYYMNLSEKYGYYNYSGTSYFKYIG